MAHICGIKIVQGSFVRSPFHKPAFVIMLASVMGLATGLTSTASNAQSNNGVMVNLGVLDDLDPMTTLPRLLMPSSQPARGRIVLTPPAGVSAITPQRSRITLRPPPGTPTRVAAAPKIAVPTPAAAAPAPPLSVTAPPPAPKPVPEIEPAASAPAPQTAEINPAPSAQSTPIGPVAQPMPAPEPPMSDETMSDEAVTDDTEANTQTASLPPADETDAPVSVSFTEEQTELPSTAADALTPLADRMKSDESLRVQLLAYASSADGSASSVRRKSLSRALSVREFLMDQGVQSTRIEVRALGDQNEGGNPNRVDAVLDQR